MSKKEAVKEEMVLALIEDAETIMDHFKNGVPNPKVIRSSFAPLLRRWIHEGDFFSLLKLYELNSKKINFLYRSSESDVKEAQERISPIWVGNLRFNDVGISMMAGAHKDQESPSEPRETSRKASIFFKQPICRLSNGRQYTREEVVKFCANKLGGAHFDRHDKQDQDLRKSLGFEVSANGTNIQMLLGDDIIEAKKDPERRSRVYDLADISLQDTAYVFAKGILDNRDLIEDLI